MFFDILSGLGPTLIVTFVGFLIAVFCAFPLAMALFKGNPLLHFVARFYVDVVRSIPLLVWLFLIFFGVGSYGFSLTPMITAIVVFGGVATAYVTEIYRAGLTAVPMGQWDAGRATGLKPAIIYRNIIVPQVLRSIGPTLATYWITLLKDSSLASIIGVLGITFQANAETQKTGDALIAFGFAGILYFVISIVVGLLSRVIDAKSRAKYAI